MRSSTRAKERTPKETPVTTRCCKRLDRRESTTQDGDRVHKKIECLSSCQRASKKEQAEIISELRQKYPLSKLLALGKMSRSTYYYQQKRLREPDKYREVREQIKSIFERNKGRYGYRRVYIMLLQQGTHLNHKTTQKLMRLMGLKGKQRKHKYRSYKGEVDKVAANTLNRQFDAQKPFEKLVTDVTEFHVCNEKVYLSPVMDLFNREIVAHSISRSPSFAQTRAMLESCLKGCRRMQRH